MAAHAEKTAILSFYVKYIFLITAKSGLLIYSSCAVLPYQNHIRVQFIINFNALFDAIGHRWRQKRNDQLRNASELQLRTRVSSEKRQIQNVCDAP